MVDFLTSIIGFLAVILIFWNLYQIWFLDKNLRIIGKITWTIFGIFLSIPTAIVYWFMFKRQEYDFFKY